MIDKETNITKTFYNMHDIVIKYPSFMEEDVPRLQVLLDAASFEALLSLELRHSSEYEQRNWLQILNLRRKMYDLLTDIGRADAERMGIEISDVPPLIRGSSYFTRAWTEGFLGEPLAQKRSISNVVSWQCK